MHGARVDGLAAVLGRVDPPEDELRFDRFRLQFYSSLDYDRLSIEFSPNVLMALPSAL